MEVDLDYLPDNFKDFKSGLGGNYDNKVHLTKKSKAINDLVIIEILEQDEDRLQRDGIYLPESTTINFDMLKGKIISVGEKAQKFNVNVNDIVLYDKASAYYGPPEKAGTLIITHVENVICVLDEE
jgi:co-chaperonin GroES (HSP10)